jgi:hypothetical protein
VPFTLYVNMDEEYDTDTISLTSTVESDNEGIFYDVKRILSESMETDEHGKPYKIYLVEWENYPLHQYVCTLKLCGNMV